ncbi:MAG TPA: alkyl hydroperoxide reductase subunit F [Candidatus Avacidaminococcus intestinavium]|uniref:Alkyl hydroperoxide reductase subunit F n=1 Tax=Candidatus Avacidaminococcus intestinavium TaxID=2840684 RepID=A0A9D1MQA2_9FIRM|nr:alkyl hydroperoxide reductase subunit F [Candidatus Avacidaminococcus intestinavium]
MILDPEIKQQLAGYLELLEGKVFIKLSAGSDAVSQNMRDLLQELTTMSPLISLEEAVLDRTPSFSLANEQGPTGITFAGIPLGHEFTSLVLALLQVSGRAPKVDDQTIKRIKSISRKCDFITYISLSCNNCPEVVQALNLMSLLNPNITHTMVDGGVFTEEVASKNIMAVPNVYLDGEPFNSGRATIEDLLIKLNVQSDTSSLENIEPFDVLVIGGGPAGTSAAIYAARKGIRTALLAENLGGQIKETVGIENFISIVYTEGSKLASNLEEHLKEYDIHIIKMQRVKQLIKKDLVEVVLTNGAVIKSKTVIIATGARWRNINVPGETQLKTKGVAYCPHCDGPFFKGKRVAVVGGGNSGVEAAIDLAALAEHVTVLQVSEKLSADVILQSRMAQKPNISVITNAKTTEITGTDKVDGLNYLDCTSDETKHLKLDGVFIQIGLRPNTEWLEGSLELNKFGEIVVDKCGATNVPGIFAAGDCTDCPYKQIIISMGSGANASLAACDYLIRN